MNITHIAYIIGIIVLVAAGGTAPLQNSSETGITRTSRGDTAITREPRTPSAEIVKVSGEAEYAYGNRDTYGILAFIRMDADSASSAQFMVNMIDSPYILDSFDGVIVHGSFTVTNAGLCNALDVTFDGVSAVLIACADGRYVNLILATDEDVAVTILQQVYQDGAFTVPAGYEEVE